MNRDSLGASIGPDWSPSAPGCCSGDYDPKFVERVLKTAELVGPPMTLTEAKEWLKRFGATR